MYRYIQLQGWCNLPRKVMEFPPKQKKCIFCEGEHWSDICQIQNTKEKRKAVFVSKKLYFNCGITGHRGSNCKSRGCLKCQARRHTSLCDRERDDDAVLTGYTPSVGEATLPAIVSAKIKSHTFRRILARVLLEISYPMKLWRKWNSPHYVTKLDIS